MAASVVPDISLVDNSVDYSEFFADSRKLQDAFWSALRQNYNYLMTTDLFEKQEDLSDARQQALERKQFLLRDLFCEQCSLLYHDICELLRDHQVPQSFHENVHLRWDQLAQQAAALHAKFPCLEEELQNRLKLVRSGLGQLDAMRKHDSCSSGDEGVGVTFSQLRRWLQAVDDKLFSIEERDISWLSVPTLQAVLKELQDLQHVIETEGGQLLQGAQKCVAASSSGISPRQQPQTAGRRRVVIGSLERRWHALWLRSLEWQCRLEQQIKQIELGLVPLCDSASDTSEPCCKRARLSDDFDWSLSSNEDGVSESDDAQSDISDTIPFHAAEYEKIGSGTSFSVKPGGAAAYLDQMDPNGNHVVFLSESDTEYTDLKGHVVCNRSAMVGDNAGVAHLKDDGQPWHQHVEIVHHDVGYSSENSTHLSSNDENYAETITIYAFTKDSQRRPVSKETTKVYHSKPVPSQKEDSANNNVEVMIGGLTNEWSADSSPSLDRCTRIEASPHKSFYKVTPQCELDETDSPRCCDLSDDSLFVYSTALDAEESVQKAAMYDGQSVNVRCEDVVGTFGLKPEMTDSMTVNVEEGSIGERALAEVLELLEHSGAGESLADRFDEELSALDKQGTVWKPFRGSNLLLDFGSGLAADSDEPTPRAEEFACDASAEMSEESERDGGDQEVPNVGPTVVVTPAEFFSSTPNSTLKRRRRRRSERPNSLNSGVGSLRRLALLSGGGLLGNGDVPGAISENTLNVMTLSLHSTTSSGGGFDCDTPTNTSFDQNCSDVSLFGLPNGYATLPKGGIQLSTFNGMRAVNLRRKKLKARRMPRSISDSEHLSYLMSRGGSMRRWIPSVDLDLSPIRVAVPPPSPTPPDPFHQNSCADNGGEDLHMQHLCTNSREDSPIPESARESSRRRFELETGGGTTGEHSETPWEWDDYKPPDHSEQGELDQPLDSSKLTEFGDDYQPFLDNWSDSASGCGSVGLAKDRLRRVPSLRNRLSPVGVSQDSDSEFEEIERMMRHSEKQLLLARNALDTQTSAIGMLELLAMCETNIRCLEALCGHLVSVGGKSVLNKQLRRVTELLGQWKTLQGDLATAGPRVMPVGENAPPAATVVKRTGIDVLRAELGELARSLREIMDQSCLSNVSVASGCYGSQVDVAEALRMFKELEVKLNAERPRLARLLNALNGSEDDGAHIRDAQLELAQLFEYCDSALLSCEKQCVALERLSTTWTLWNDSVAVSERLLANLDRRLGEFEQLSCGAVQNVTDAKDAYKALQVDVLVCEARLQRLRDLAMLLGDAGQQEALVTVDFGSIHAEFAGTLHALKQRLANAFDRVLDEHLGMATSVVEAAGATTTTVVRRRTINNERQASLRAASLSSSPRRGAFSYCRRALKASWPVQLCLLLLVCLGVYVALEPTCCSHQNNWRFAFGPQIHFVRGPPPS